MTEYIRLQEREIPYEILYSRRKTISLEVTAKGQVKLRLPLGCHRQEGIRFLEQRTEWLLQALQKMQKRQELLLRQQAQVPQITPEQVSRLRLRAKEELTAKADLFAAKMGVTYAKLTVKDQKTRWGSCSARGNLNFNWRIILAPEPVTDYVVIHELAHRIHMNHSEAFYRTVEAVMPDYREQVRWLKTQGAMLMQAGHNGPG